MTPRRGAARAWLKAGGVLLAAALMVAAYLSLQAERKLSTLALGGLGESFSTRVWSAPFLLRGGAPAETARLCERLERLGYRRVEAAPAKGQYAA